MGERMQGKTALVTGATSNIGRAIAIAFAAEGANVVVSGRSASRGGEVVQEIRRAGGHAQFVAADLDGSARAHGSCLPQLWMLSAAGSTCSSTAPASFRAQPRRLSTKRCSTRSTRSTSRRRSSSPLRSMTARGSGSIINLGSWVARLGIPVGALYASTKGAMETLTRAWAAEFGSPGVRVNAISPGVVRTGIENDPATAMMRGTPYGAFGTPDAIAHAAVHLRRIAVRQRHGHRR